jgi:hypothetical protein
MKKLKTIDVELSVVKYLKPRINLIVPNISWGLNIHECDLFVLSKSGYATEIEIKVSRSDLKKDLDKRHHHKSNKIKKLYFAIPDYMLCDIELIPKHAGILIVNQRGRCTLHREAVINEKSYKFSDAERFQVARLGALRIWNLKKRIKKLQDLK